VVAEFRVNLRFIRIWLGKQRLDAVFSDAEKRRMVRYVWKSKVRSDAPQPNWYEVVTKELEFTDSQNLRPLVREY
jgi:hypothetical protein